MRTACAPLFSGSSRPYGYGVIVAGSGEESISLARSYDGTIDVLLTDVMPKMSGTDLAAALAEERDGITVIFMSGYQRNRVSNRERG
jgi:two-component system, cell cycle sensor histidine kinase and response regulator CckA